MGWLIAAGIVVLIALIPIGVRFRYDADGIFLAVLLGAVKIRILPAKKKSPEQNTKEKEKMKRSSSTAQKKPQTEPPPAPDQTKKGGSIRKFLPLVKVGLSFLNDFRRKIRIDNLQVKLIMAGGDPCDLAVHYAKAWEALGNLIPRLERVFAIKKRNIEVECDFCAEEMTVIVGSDITITLGRLLSLAVRYGYRAVREWLKINKRKKASADK